jgi:hypothetical protein
MLFSNCLIALWSVAIPLSDLPPVIARNNLDSISTEASLPPIFREEQLDGATEEAVSQIRHQHMA